MKTKNFLAISLSTMMALSFSVGGYISTLDLVQSIELKPAKIAFAPLPNFKSVKDIQQRKQRFFDYLLPMVLEANKAITAERKQVIKLAEKDDLTDTDILWLEKKSKKYDVSLDLIPEQQINALLRRVDIIPPSLVLAQAANESAWGTSRFARTGNNLFGQWCYSKGCGIVPRHRNKNSKHEVQKFASVYDSVKSYMLNINSNVAYTGVRKIRRDLRKNDATISGSKLANGLIRYSERKEAYVKEIKHMIQLNQLYTLDALPSATLAKSG
ncbi:MAG: glucosaminidase domain-containing protein [Hahellaceae bacterium]|nr:glucosaminidase domain-containing protein [Hahellaceae bacterium]MCP5211244.1 glucosaminidase domain-containing protein [Hahellaceae bacterium]